VKFFFARKPFAYLYLTVRAVVVKQSFLDKQANIYDTLHNINDNI